MEILATFGMLAALLAPPAVAQSDSAKPQVWRDDADYPAGAVARSKADVAAVRFEVTENGRAENCTVVESSGSDALDHKSCALVLKVAHFKVAKDEQGRAIRSVQTRKVNWAKSAN